MYVIYKDFSMLTCQTGVPPNQPTGLQVKDEHHFGIFPLIWQKPISELMKFEMQCFIPIV